MSADVEQEAGMASGARMPAHLSVPLQHDGIDILFHEGVGGGEPGGTAADDDDALSHPRSRDSVSGGSRRRMVRAEGLEPPRVLPHQGLNLAPMPIRLRPRLRMRKLIGSAAAGQGRYAKSVPCTTVTASPASSTRSASRRQSSMPPRGEA